MAYLVWLGVRAWRDPADDLGSVEAKPAVFWRGCAIAAINPKTLLFNAAFLPQFVPATGGAVDLGVVATVFVAVLLAGDLAWAVGAGAARPIVARYGRLRNRLTGGFLVAAGVGLALARRTAP